MNTFHAIKKTRAMREVTREKTLQLVSSQPKYLSFSFKTSSTSLKLLYENISR